MVIIGARAGQLGNRLFVFAHFIANAIEYGYEVGNPSFYGYSQYFEGTRDDFFCRYPSRKTGCNSPALQVLFYKIINKVVLPLSKIDPLAKLLTIRFLDMPRKARAEECYDMKDPDYLNLATSKHILFIKDAWFFRDPANIMKHADYVRSFFRPVEQHVSAVSRLIAGARTGCDVLVGIHLRQGDYKRWQGGTYYFSSSEYAAVMSRFCAIMPDKQIKFLICSNEKQDVTLFQGLNYIMGNNHQLEDMYAFAQCDFLIGPPSTYTLWSSFYGSVPLFTLKTAGDTISLDDFHISQG